MKQREYTDLQLIVMEILGRIGQYRSAQNASIQEEMEKIKKDFGIEPPYLTLRQYIETNCSGSYHTFWFIIKGQEINVTDLGGFLTDEYCHLFAETNKYYVVQDESIGNGGDCENYHCDHYLTLEPKED